MSWKEIIKEEYESSNPSGEWWYYGRQGSEDDTPEEILEKIDELYEALHEYSNLVEKNSLPITRSKWEDWWVPKYGPLIKELEKLKR